jgi:hypothetical protein
MNSVTLGGKGEVGQARHQDESLMSEAPLLRENHTKRRPMMKEIYGKKDCRN